MRLLLTTITQYESTITKTTSTRTRTRSILSIQAKPSVVWMPQKIPISSSSNAKLAVTHADRHLLRWAPWTSWMLAAVTKTSKIRGVSAPQAASVQLSVCIWIILISPLLTRETMESIRRRKVSWTSRLCRCKIRARCSGARESTWLSNTWTL